MPIPTTITAIRARATAMDMVTIALIILQEGAILQAGTRLATLILGGVMKTLGVTIFLDDLHIGAGELC